MAPETKRSVAAVWVGTWTGMVVPASGSLVMVRVGRGVATMAETSATGPRRLTRSVM